MRLGAHISIAGGVDLALDRGQSLSCEAIQIFVKNNNQWRAAPLSAEVIQRFREKAGRGAIRPIVAHTAYLLNLASPDDALWHKSREAFEVELERCDALGIPYLVLHPGSHMGAGEEVGIQRAAKALDETYGRRGFRTMTLLEHTAGQGNQLGYRFEHLAAIRNLAHAPHQIGVCLDTCHLFAAGYDYRKAEQYEALLQEFDSIVGLEWLKCLHLNDCKTELGSRVDRHEHIGKGKIGKAGFKHWLNDPRLAGLPGLLETPTDATGKWEKQNLRALRRLVEA